MLNPNSNDEEGFKWTQYKSKAFGRPRFRWKVNALEMRVGCESLLAGYSPASIESDKVSVTLDQKAIAPRDPKLKETEKLSAIKKIERHIVATSTRRIFSSHDCKLAHPDSWN